MQEDDLRVQYQELHSILQSNQSQTKMNNFFEWNRNSILSINDSEMRILEITLRHSGLSTRTRWLSVGMNFSILIVFPSVTISFIKRSKSSAPLRTWLSGSAESWNEVRKSHFQWFLLDHKSIEESSIQVLCTSRQKFRWNKEVFCLSQLWQYCKAIHKHNNEPESQKEFKKTTYKQKIDKQMKTEDDAEIDFVVIINKTLKNRR